MATDNDKGTALRDALEKALDKDRPKDVTSALQGLEQLEPNEPRWPQKVGDYFLRKARKQEAEAAYVRAFNVLSRQGFLPRAVAMAKLIVEINPARTDILDKINQDAAKTLRAKVPLATGLRAPPPPVVAIQEVSPALALPETAAPTTYKRLSLAPGAPIPDAVASARPLSRSLDASIDEVRFEDLGDEDLVELDASDMEVISLSPARNAPALAPPDPSAALISRLSATTLFADVSARTLAALVVAAQRIELRNGDLVVGKGERADAMFVITDGVARVVLPAMQSGGVDLAAGQIFGEACLVRRGRRQADVRAKGKLILLRIGIDDLRRIMGDHPELGWLLFDLLAGRLVANLLQTSSLFAAFDKAQRKELARMFEVRQAPSGTVLQELGKRSDGLYVALMGQFDMEEGGLVATLSPGSIFGHASLLTRTPADRTIRAATDAVVLRMPASRFSAFASQFPPALEYLAELASQPLSMWPSD